MRLNELKRSGDWRAHMVSISDQRRSSLTS
ncbi:Uncharacterised protein [Mycobacteroides abscessus subsp. abscessus]|nr:Uncharacterised protein [Mycobacteroides abscessus subsp. abscessus]